MPVFLKRNILTIAGILLGGLAGYIYWRQVGCVSGTCAITSHPLRSTAYGALMGGLLFSMFSNTKIKKDQV